MVGEDAGGFLNIAGQRCIDDGLVFRMHVAGNRLAKQGQAPIALRLEVQDVLEMANLAGRAGGDQDLVEHPVALFPFLPGGIAVLKLLLGP